MDDAATALRKQRQLQMEEKRKRLEDLRQRRKDKQRPQYSFQPPTNTLPSVMKHEEGDLEEVIQDLLGKDHLTTTNEGGQIYTRTGEEMQEKSQTLLQPDASLRAVELSKSGVIGLVNESYVKPEFYDKECQTEHQIGDDVSSDENDNAGREELQGGGVDDNQRRRLSAGSSLARRCLAGSASVVTTNSFEPHEPDVGNASINATQGVKELSEGDKNSILCSEEFKLFMGDAARVVDRALNERNVFDILLDYREINDNEDEESVPSRSGGLRVVHHAHDQRWSANRSITDMHCSPHHAEHFLASYGVPGGGLGGRGSGDISPDLPFRGGRGGSSDDPDGVVLVWSLTSEECPELIFHAQSPVLVAKFHAFDQNLVAGATYLGEVLVWDTRAKSLPAQRTRLVAGGHTYPVYSLEIVGTSSTHTIVTASTDGKVSWWDPRQLATPMESMLVVAPPSDESNKCRLNTQQSPTLAPATTSPVAITCMDHGGGMGAYADSDTEVMVMGSESGDLYVLPTRAHHCKGIQRLSGHCGMVTSVDFHPSSSYSSSSVLSGLMVSSSVDWTTKLWHKNHSGQGGTRALATLSSGRYDYVCSAQWSPGRPSLLATGNSSGNIDMWDLLHSIDEPLISATQESLTKLAWSKDGRCIMTGDNVGALRIFAVPQEVVMPRPDEESKLDHLLWGLVAPHSTGESGLSSVHHTNHLLSAMTKSREIRKITAKLLRSHNVTGQTNWAHNL